MAGNTKLIGFSNDGELVLERWGKRAKVSVSEPSLTAVRHACSNALPSKPNVPFRTCSSAVGYDSTYGRVSVELSPEFAKKLCDYIDKGPGWKEELKLDDMAEGIKEALEEHRNYTNTDEPGVE